MWIKEKNPFDAIALKNKGDSLALILKNKGIALIGKNDSTREFFIEEEKIGKEKFQVLIMKEVNSDKTNFREIKDWINKKGLIIKTTYTNSSGGPRIMDSAGETTYDYKVKPPKIEPPIK